MAGGLSLKEGVVLQILAGWPGVQELLVSKDGQKAKALLLLDLLPPVQVGATVLLNATASELGLGTGGYDFVVSHPRAASPQSQDGHLMKLRYTPFQLKVGGPEDPEDPRHGLLQEATSLDGMPVAAAELHSQVAAVAGGFRAVCPKGRLAYVMTDGGSLPYRISRLAQSLRQSGLISFSVSAGQAFGGEFEAVTVHSALLLARHVLQADAAVVAIGPGLLGSGTPFGHSGIAQGEALNAVLSLGGRPVAVPRLSKADGRDRHRGLSHHSRTVLSRIVLGPVTIALPLGLPEDLRQTVEAVGGPAHRLVLEPLPGDWMALLQGAGVRLSTMGKSYEDDPWIFDAGAAAGAIMGRWVATSGKAH